MDIIEYGSPIKLELAKRVINAAIRKAKSNNLSVTISVFDSTCHLVAIHRMDGAQYGSIEISQAKAETSVNYKRSTKFYDEAVSSGGNGLRILSVNDISPFEGGIPLVKKGKIIGAIGVSGAKPDQDGMIASAGANIVNV